MTIIFADVQIPDWLQPRLGPANQDRVRREALRSILNQTRDEALGEDWQEKYSCWEIQLATEVVGDFWLTRTIAKMEEEEQKTTST